MRVNLSVFDLDHTLLNANSSFRFGAYLYRQKFFSFFSLLACLGYYSRHKLLGMSIQEVHQRVFSHIFSGRSLEEIRKYVNSFLEKDLNRMLYLPVLQRLREAQSRGDYTLILSSSPDFLVGPIAERLRVKEWKASIYSEDRSGNLFQISRILEGQGKADYVTALSSLLGIDSSAITVYSDSYLDLPVLKMAGKAIAVDPDSQLRRICQVNGWEIL